jgi:hypothetical protein
MKRVAILTHPKLPLQERHFLAALARLWREDGLDVAVAKGVDALPDADLAIPHLPLTVRPAEYDEALRRYPRALNAGAVDISKRRVSRLAAEPGYDGPVIVKSNLNAHGLTEARLRGGRAWNYRVFESAAELPAEVRSHPDLIVERFEPELEDGLFWLRTWDFLGDREAGSRYSSEDPIAQGERMVWREALKEVPEELRRRRAELGLDYGSFDYGVADGQVFLYDVNWTPATAALPPERAADQARTLAEGLRSFL